MRHHLLRESILLGVSLIAAVSVNAQTTDNPLGLKAHHVTATVLDLERSIQWYQRVLGFKLTQQGGHGAVQFAVLSIPGFDVSLVKTPETKAPAPQRNQESPRWVHIVFSAPDPNRLFADLKSSGANPYTRYNDKPGPLKSFLIQDSEGNEIEIVSAEEGAPK